MNIKTIGQLLDYVETEEKAKDLINYINKQKEVLNKIKEYIKEDMYGEPNELYGLVDGEHILELLEGIE